MKTYRLWLIGLLAAGACPGVAIEQYHSHDFAFSATVRGNPFDAELKGEFTGPGGVRIIVPGFYDGGGTFVSRPRLPEVGAFRRCRMCRGCTAAPKPISDASRTATR